MSVRSVTARNFFAKRIRGIGAVDSSIAFRIRYKGAYPCKLQCNSAGQALLAQIDTGVFAADPEFTVGAVPGTIDLTNATVDTLGELVDVINAFTNYEAEIINGLRAGDVKTASVLIDFALTETDVKTPEGRAFYWDTSNCLHHQVMLSLVTKAIEKNYRAQAPFNASLPLLYRLIANATFAGGGNTTIQIYEVDRVAKTDTLIWSAVGAATTVDKEIIFYDGFEGNVGKDLLVGFTAPAGPSAASLLLSAKVA